MVMLRTSGVLIFKHGIFLGLRKTKMSSDLVIETKMERSS